MDARQPAAPAGRRPVPPADRRRVEPAGQHLHQRRLRQLARRQVRQERRLGEVVRRTGQRAGTVEYAALDRRRRARATSTSPIAATAASRCSTATASCNARSRSTCPCLTAPAPAIGPTPANPESVRGTHGARRAVGDLHHAGTEPGALRIRRVSGPHLQNDRSRERSSARSARQGSS